MTCRALSGTSVVRSGRRRSGAGSIIFSYCSSCTSLQSRPFCTDILASTRCSCSANPRCTTAPSCADARPTTVKSDGREFDANSRKFSSSLRFSSPCPGCPTSCSWSPRTYSQRNLTATRTSRRCCRTSVCGWDTATLRSTRSVTS